MFTQKHTALFTIAVKHPFYKDLISKDFTFLPIGSTAELLNAYGLTAKTQEGRLIVLQHRTGTDEVFQPIDAPLDLFFLLRTRSVILNITETFANGRYLFTNLNEDGSYRAGGLTNDQTLSAGDKLLRILRQNERLAFDKGVFKQIVLKKITGTQLDVAAAYEINETETYKDLQVNSPGKFLLEKIPAAGQPAMETVLISDEIYGASPYYGVIHLQLPVDFAGLDYGIELKPKESRWQYVLVEPQEQKPPYEKEKLAFEYKAKEGSKYPQVMNFNLKEEADFPDQLKKLAETLKKGAAAGNLFVFESSADIKLAEGMQPEIMLKYGDKTLAKKMKTPDIRMKEPQIIYNL